MMFTTPMFKRPCRRTTSADFSKVRLMDTR
jgi:hypothetical protein